MEKRRVNNLERKVGMMKHRSSAGYPRDRNGHEKRRRKRSGEEHIEFTRFSIVEKFEMYWRNRNPNDAAFVEAILAGDQDSRRIIGLFANKGPKGNRPSCYEVRDPEMGRVLVCPKLGWRRVRDRRICIGCFSVMASFELNNHGEITAVYGQTLLEEIPPEEVEQGIKEYYRALRQMNTSRLEATKDSKKW